MTIELGLKLTEVIEYLLFVIVILGILKFFSIRRMRNEHR